MRSERVKKRPHVSRYDSAARREMKKIEKCQSSRKSVNKRDHVLDGVSVVKVKRAKNGRGRPNVGEVVVNKHLTRGLFYNPAVTIARAIQDSLNVEKVIAEAPKAPKEVHVVSGPPGVKIPVNRILSTNEHGSLRVRFHSGNECTIYSRAITEVGDGFVRVYRWYLRRFPWLWKVYSGTDTPNKIPLSKEEVRQRFLELRREKGKGNHEK